MAVLLQVLGLILLAAGVLVWFGPGPALVVSGAAATAAGTAVEVDRRRAA